MAAVKVAIVLFVRNEIRDLSSWLAWHMATGCSTFVVYDDHSTDGTWELLARVAKRVDIRAFRTDQTVAGFEQRQRDSYRDALERYRGEIEWLLFIDADEYLLIDGHRPVEEFAGSLPGADGIAIHWCNYGSSGHALRPPQPVVEAYTRHSLPTNPINRHVKSLVRTSRVGSRFINVHCFDIEAGRYLDPVGRPVEWSAVAGITAGDPDWRGAKLMHFQCRSMEHFIERLKQRPDVPATTGTWHEYDMNDVEDVRFRSLLPTFHQHYHLITGMTDETVMRALKKEFARIIPFPQPRPRLTGVSKPFLVRTAGGTYLADRGDGGAAEPCSLADIASDRARPLLFVIPTDEDGREANWGILVLPRLGGWLQGEMRRGRWLAYRLEIREWPEVILSVPADGAVLAALPGNGAVRIERHRVPDRETFALVPLDAPELGDLTTPPDGPPILPPLPRAIGDPGGFVDWVRATPADNAGPVFDMLARTLRRGDRARINGDSGISLRD